MRFIEFVIRDVTQSTLQGRWRSSCHQSGNFRNSIILSNFPTCEARVSWELRCSFSTACNTLFREENPRSCTTSTVDHVIVLLTGEWSSAVRTESPECVSHHQRHRHAQAQARHTEVAPPPHPLHPLSPSYLGSTPFTCKI